MGRHILIVDDDADFNQLLTDIFSQASYEVQSSLDPEQALEKFRSGEFDLVVTDQKMPGLTGEQFIRKIKEINADVPVVMVSGYLDNDTIRSLIREGVGGVFLKPLNVFSLLKRTAALIEEREAGMRREAGDAEDAEDEAFHHKLPFSFESFPAKDRRAREFAQKLYDLRDFKVNLVMTTPRGTDVLALAEDFKRFDPESGEPFHVLDRAQISESEFLRLVQEATAGGAPRVTFFIAGAESVSREQYSVIMRLGRKKEPFDRLTCAVRFVFCVGRDLDSLYDERLIDDAVYMFMGTSEIQVPRLSDVPDDIPELARRYLLKEAEAHGLPQTPRLELTAKTYLREQPWPGNAAELHRFMRMAIHLDKRSLAMDDMERIERKMSSAVAGARNLRQALHTFRDDYIRAVGYLVGDAGQAAEALGADPDLVEPFLRH